MFTGRMVQDSYEDYHAVKAVSNSGIPLLLSCAAKFRAWQDGEAEREDTESFLFGRVLHCLAFEPDEFGSRYAIKRENGATKAGKEEKAIADASGLKQIKIEAWHAAKSMADAVRRKDRVKKYLSLPDRKCEVSVYWDEEWEGVTIPCKARIDEMATIPGMGVTPADLKSTKDASPIGFGKAIYDYGYDRQGAWYLRGLNASGVNASNFMLIAVEKEAPYIVTAGPIAQRALEKGKEKCEQALSIYADSIKTGKWLCYSEELIELDMPEWAYR